MHPTDATLQYLANMLSELEQYLLSPELFWPLSSKSSAPGQDRLTLGNLLLSLDKINAVQQTLDTQQETVFRKSNVIWEQSLVKWRGTIEQKGEHEINSRMRLWHAYLNDLDERQGGSFDYKQEVRNRVIIERLFDLGISRDLLEVELQHLDQLNQSLVIPSEFIWPPSLQSQYPQQQYWFLYRTPRNSDRH